MAVLIYLFEECSLFFESEPDAAFCAVFCSTRLYKSNTMALAALVLNVFIEPLFYQKNKNPSSAWSLVGVLISVNLVAAASTDFN